MVGKKQIPTDQVSAGDIGAVAKLVLTQTNDTLCDRSRIVTLPAINVPDTVSFDGNHPEIQGEEDKIMAGLHKLSDEDPVFTVTTNAETRQMVISGLGEQEILRSEKQAQDQVQRRLHD
jgi:elongation factor G